jgi:signal transduction histidine kinase/ABC-type multidrug transport system ATPase subunit
MVAAPARSPLLQVRGLSKRFGRHVVLDEVDLEVHAGELVALVGENGAGKSTLVRCIAGTLTPDAGAVHLSGGRSDVGVVWQDLALCENLDAVANLFLGRELGGRWLSEADMHVAARSLLSDLGIVIDDLSRPASQLSGGQRQTLAIARALLGRSQVLVLDEPTAALGVAETHLVERVVRELRSAGCGVLLISHRIEQVFRLADRVVVMRHGRVAANRATLELHPDDVIALMAGVDADTTARQQIQRLRSLVDQLAEEEPSASIPLIVSALSSALGVDQMCVHLLDAGGGQGDPPVLTRRAAVGVREPLLAVNEVVPVGPAGGLVGLAAERQDVVVTEDVRRHPAWEGLQDQAEAAGISSAWAMPIQDTDGVLGVISAYAPAVGSPQPAALELVALYTNLAAAAIARERLLGEVTRRNRILEAMRGMLETLTGPLAAHAGMAPALGALCDGLAADAVALLGASAAGEPPALRAVTGLAGGPPPPGAAAELAAAAAVLLDGPAGVDRARVIGDRAVGAPVLAPQGRLVLAAWWSEATGITNDTLDLLDDAARSLSLAAEREEVESAHAEAATLRRSQILQREFLSHLSHELRTPLTAIHGYASTLRQPDVTWDAASGRRFLGLIEGESARMGRLVADMLDSSTMEAGGLRLDPHWCDLGLAVEAAVACVPGADAVVAVEVGADVPKVWVDHDRLEQVLVNLVDNALRHGGDGGPVRVTATATGDTATIRVTDQGPGFPPALAASVFQPYVRGATGVPGAGLGLTICRGLVEAHGGDIAVEPTGAGACVRVRIPVDPLTDPDTLVDNVGE